MGKAEKIGLLLLFFFPGIWGFKTIGKSQPHDLHVLMH